MNKQAIALILSAFLTVAAFGAKNEAIPDQQKFEELCQKIQQGSASLQKQEIDNFISMGFELGRPLSVASALKGLVVSASGSSAETIQRIAAKNAVESGELRSALSRYKSYLAVASPTEESSEAASEFYSLLIDYLGMESDAYAFMKSNGEKFRKTPASKQYDVWFMNMAKRNNEPIEVAKRLALIFSEPMPFEKEVFFFADYLDYLTGLPIISAMPYLPYLKTIASSIKGNYPSALKFKLYLEAASFIATATEKGLAGKENETTEKLFQNVINAASLYIKTLPDESTLRDCINIINLNFTPQGNMHKKQKEAFFIENFPKLSLQEQISFLKNFGYSYRTWICTEDGWQKAFGAAPLAFIEAEKLFAKMSSSALSPVINQIASSTKPFVAAINVIASQNNCDAALMALLKNYSWCLTSEQILYAIKEVILPNYETSEKNSKELLANTLSKVGAEYIAKSPLPIESPTAISNLLQMAVIGNKQEFLKFLSALEWVPYSKAESDLAFSGAYNVFKEWSKVASRKAELVSTQKNKIEAYEKALTRKKAAQAKKEEAQKTGNQTMLQEASREFAEADTECLKLAGAASDAKEELAKMKDSISDDEIAALSKLEETFRNLMDKNAPPSTRIEKAPNDECKELAKLKLAVLEKNSDQYIALARNIYRNIRDMHQTKKAFASSILAFITSNRLDAFDTFDLQLEILKDQLALAGTNLLMPGPRLTIAGIINGRAGWPSAAKEADKEKVLKVNQAYEQALINLAEKSAFSSTAFEWLLATRSGQGWGEATAGQKAIEAMIEKNVLRKNNYRPFGALTAGAVYHYLVKAYYPALNDRFPIASYFDDMVIEECKELKNIDMLYLSQSVDEKGKLFNYAVQYLIKFSSLPVNYTYLNFNQTSDLFKVHAYVFSVDREMRKKRSINEEERKKLIATLAANSGKTRFDSFAMNAIFFNDDFPIGTGESGRWLSEQFTIFMNKSASLPIRLAAPPMSVFAKAKSLSSEEAKAFANFIVLNKCESFPKDSGWEKIGELLPRKLLEEKKYKELSLLASAIWRTAIQCKSVDLFRFLADFVNDLSKKELVELAALYASLGLDVAGTSLTEDVRINLSSIKMKGLSGLAMAIPVDRTDPRYPVYLAQLSWSSGNIKAAMDLLAQSKNRMKDMINELDPNFLIWFINRSTETADYNFAEDLCRAGMHFYENLKDSDPEIRAKLMIAYADVALARQEYPRARALFDKIVNTKEFIGTAAGYMAEMKLALVEQKTKNYDAALERLNKVAQMADRPIQAKAYYQMATIKFEQEDFAETAKLLEQSLTLDPAFADAKILRGELDNAMKRYHRATEIIVGLSTEDKIIVPGKNLKIQMDDKNLTVAGKSKVVSLRVWTDAGDEEQVSLIPLEGSMTRFEAQLKTELGAPIKNDKILQVNGADTVYYDFTDSFKKINNITDSKPVSLKIASDAKLSVSAGLLLSEEEERQREFDALVARAQGETMQTKELASITGVRTNLTVRPGNPIYVRVIDPDRSISEKKDNLTIDVSAYSGDAVKGFLLEETSPFSGIFEGAISTTNAGALAYASDSDEGRFPYFAISADNSLPAWVALPDGKKPKIFTVDINDNIRPGKLTIVSDVPGRKLKQFYLQTSLDGKKFKTIAGWPNNIKVWDGDPIFEFAIVKDDIQLSSCEAIRQYIENSKIGFNAGSVSSDATKFEAEKNNAFFQIKSNLIPLQWQSAKDKYAACFKAAFYIPQKQTRTLHLIGSAGLNPRNMFLIVDSEEILPADIKADRITCKKLFEQGLHFVEVYFVSDRTKAPSFELQMDIDVPPYIARCPIKMFSKASFPAETANIFSNVLSIASNPEKTIFTTEFPTGYEMRILRLVLTDFETDAPAIRKIKLANNAGIDVLPVKSDFANARNNKMLEIVPGDKISIIYRDPNPVEEKNAIQEKIITADYYNGSIMAYTIARTGGLVHTNRINRYTPGSKIDVLIDDSDCDISQNRDVITFTAKVGTQKSIQLRAMETEPQSGIFIGALFTVTNTPTRSNELQVAIGDDVVLEYMDKENTEPGIPWTRRFIVKQIMYQPPQLRIFDVESASIETSKVGSIAVSSEKAILISKEEMVPSERDLIYTRPGDAGKTEPARIMLNAPLVIELLYPTISFSANSRASLYIQPYNPSSNMLNNTNASFPSFDITLPGTIEVKAVPSKIKFMPTPKGYRRAIFKGEDPNAGDPINDGRFIFVISNTLGNASLKNETSGETVQQEEDEEQMMIINPPLKIYDHQAIRVALKYKDEAGKETYLIRHANSFSDAFLHLMDKNYQNELSTINVGESLYLRVIDYARDVSDEKDSVNIIIKTAAFTTNIVLQETFEHTGIFKTSVRLVHFEDKESLRTPDALPVRYGEKLTVVYRGSNNNTVEKTVSILKGSDGAIVAFSKRFNDQKIAVRTQFSMAEAYFEMAKNHRKLGQKAIARKEISAGKKLLEEAIKEFPGNEERAQADYLLADLALEFAEDAEDTTIKKQKYVEAINMFNDLIQRFPDSPYAPKAQYRKALAYEKMGEMDQACEEYVKLSYLYPDNELVAETIARLANYFIAKGKEFENESKATEAIDKASEEKRLILQARSKEMFRTAAQVASRLYARFPTHPLAGKTMVISGQCYMMAGDFIKAADTFETAIAAVSGDNDLAAEAMYWRGDAFMKAATDKNTKIPPNECYEKAYQQFKKLTWDYPASKWAKFARGRLTEEALDEIAKRESEGR